MISRIYVKFDDGFSVYDNYKEVLILPDEEAVASDINKHVDAGTHTFYITGDVQNEELKLIKEETLKNTAKVPFFMHTIPFIVELRNVVPMVFSGLSEIFVGDYDVVNDKAKVILRVHEPKFTITNEYGEHFDVHDVIHEIRFFVKRSNYGVNGLLSRRLSSTYLNRKFQHPHQRDGVGNNASYCMGDSELGRRMGTGFVEEISSFSIAMMLKTIKEFVRGESVSGTPHRRSLSHLDFSERVSSADNTATVLTKYNENKELFIRKADIRLKSDGSTVEVILGKEFDHLMTSNKDRENNVISDITYLYKRCAAHKSDNSDLHERLMDTLIIGKKIPLSKEEVDDTVNSYFNRGGSIKDQLISIHKQNVENVLKTTGVSESLFQEG